MLRRLSLFVLVVSAAVPLRAATAEDVARAFYERFAAGDVAGAAELWVPEQRAAFVRDYERTMRIRCMRLERVEFTAVNDIIHARAEVMEWKFGARAIRTTRNDRLALRRAGDSWQIESFVPRERELVEQLIAAPPSSRRDLLFANRELMTFELMRIMTQRATTLSNEDRLADASALAVLGNDLADFLGDARATSLLRGFESIMARRRDRDDARSAVLAEEAVALAELDGDADVLARAFVRLARARMSKLSDTIPQLVERALSMTEQLEDLSTAAMAATEGARYYDNKQRPREALAHSLLAERYAEESGNIAARMSAQMNLGGAYNRKADCFLSLRHYHRALALSREAAFPSVTAEILGNIALCERFQGDQERGAQLLSEAITLLQQSDAADEILGQYVHRASTFAEQGKFAEAEADLVRATEAAATDGGLDLIQHAHGIVRARQRRYAEALEIWSALGPFQESPKYVYAAALRGAGRYEEAERMLRRLIKEGEEMRPVVSTDYRQAINFTQYLTPSYQELVDLLIDCGRTAEALDAYERHRSRILREVLGSGGAAVMQTLTSAEQNRVAELEQKIARGSERDIASARTELADIAARAFADDPNERWPVQPPPPDIATMNVPPDATFVEFAVLPDRTIVFIVTGNRQGRPIVRTSVIPIRRDDLRKRVAEFIKGIETRDFAVAMTAEELYSILLSDLRLPPEQRLYIIPDDALWQLPFHALKPSPRRYLAEIVTVSYAPSIALIRNSSAASSGSNARIVALGDPQRSLPDAAAEARALRAFYGSERSTIAVRGKATKAALEKADDYDILHIAAHAVVDEERPLYSALILNANARGEDRTLDAREIVSLDLRKRLVVLAACETARGRTIAAEGVVGLSWAVLAAGARATVLSLWKTDSASTAETMIEFHRHYSRGTPAAEALRNAQLAILARPQYRHPLYWAPFVVMHGGRTAN